MVSAKQLAWVMSSKLDQFMADQKAAVTLSVSLKNNLDIRIWLISNSRKSSYNSRTYILYVRLQTGVFFCEEESKRIEEVSSANLTIWTRSSNLIQKSLANKMETIWPSTVHCGIPWYTVAQQSFYPAELECEPVYV